MSRFLFNLGKTSTAVLAASLLFGAAQAEAAVPTASDAATGVQAVSTPSSQLIARKKTRKKVVRTRSRGGKTTTRVIITRPGTPASTSTTTVETTTTPPAPNTPPAPTGNTVPAAVPQSQVETDTPVSQQEFDRLRGQVEDYRGAIEGLDAKVSKAGAGFSTTTKLVGEVIIGVNGYGGVSSVTGGPTQLSGTTLTDRVRLNFDTSFTGKDKLRTRLQSRDTNSFNGGVTGTNMTRLGFDGNDSNGTNGNSTTVSLLQYTFPLNDATTVRLETTGAEYNENMNTFNPLLASAGTGSISRFGRYNPIYRQSGDGAALTVNNKLGDNLELSLGYAVPGQSTTAATPNTTASPANNTGGLFNGSNAAIAQLAFKPSDALSLGVTYARSYSTSGTGLAGSTGSSGSAFRSTGMAANIGADSPFNGIKTSANHYSFAASYNLGGPVLSGWYGWTEANAENGSGASASTNNWAATLALPDFGSKGNTLGFVVGQQPKLNSLSGVSNTTVDSASSLHLEALYKMKMSDNLDITPGLLLITNPENNASNGTEYVGTIRTTFKF